MACSLFDIMSLLFTLLLCFCIFFVFFFFDVFFFFFFFSSRRRHTRCGRDWSSDVCSSDLADAHNLQLDDQLTAIINGRRQTLTIVGIAESPEFIYVIPPGGMLPDYQQIGRASCRERV